MAKIVRSTTPRLKRELGAESLDEVYLHYTGRRYSDATRLTEVAG